MSQTAAHQTGHRDRTRLSVQTVPWYREFTMRIGLEGKLILCFIAVLCLAMAATCIIFNNASRDCLSDIMGEQARQVATALSLTSQRMARDGEWQELNGRGRELIKSRNILFVGFLDANARPKALASRDLDFALANLTFDSQSLMQVSRRESPTFGQYLEVMAPILSTATAGEEDSGGVGRTKLLGYVAVGVSQMREETQMTRVRWLVIGIACVTLVCAVPAAFLLVHRIFLPIRHLKGVAAQISGGNLDVRTEIHRLDVIGDLSRSFDDMVARVKKQQEDLAAANEMLEEANHDLERKIEQRTAQLEMANNRLVSEIAEKEQFLRAVSHDLNAPLRNISGIATMLLSKHGEEFPKDVVYRLERIKSNVDVQGDLISELLELSRIRTRRQAMEPVGVEQLVEELRGIFEEDLRRAQITLCVDTPLPKLNAERARVRQIFQNLIDNAIKYIGDGPRREIHIGCALHHTEVEFYVRDTGMGIESDDLSKIFFVFRRGRNTSQRNIPGKGVGLASVKSIVETYSGTIWATSEPGQGTTLRFTLNGRYLLEQDSKPQSPDNGRAAA
jgi:signal transduction histidine kinase